MAEQPERSRSTLPKWYLQLLKEQGIEFLQFPAGRDRPAPARRRIGPEGGILTCGPHLLLIQEHAVSTATTFSMAETHVPGDPNSVAVEIRAGKAEHLALFRPVVLVMSYQGGRLRDGKRSRILPLDWEHGSVPLHRGIHNPQEELVYTSLEHLSTYALVAT